jgi:hypothetical protein
MDKFLFYFIYKRQLKENKGRIGSSRYMACLFVSLAIFFYIGLIYSIARYCSYNYLGRSIAFSLGTTGRFGTVVFMFLILFFVWRHYDLTKIQEISDYYASQEKNIYRFVNFVKFFLIYLIPLLISIYLVNHSIVKQNH